MDIDDVLAVLLEADGAEEREPPPVPDFGITISDLKDTDPKYDRERVLKAAKMLGLAVALLPEPMKKAQENIYPRAGCGGRAIVDMSRDDHALIADMSELASGLLAQGNDSVNRPYSVLARAHRMIEEGLSYVAHGRSRPVEPKISKANPYESLSPSFQSIFDQATENL